MNRHPPFTDFKDPTSKSFTHNCDNCIFGTLCLLCISWLLKGALSPASFSVLECLFCPKYSAWFPHSWQRILRAERADLCGGAAARRYEFLRWRLRPLLWERVAGWSSSQAEPAGLLWGSSDTGTPGRGHKFSPLGLPVTQRPFMFNLEHTAINTCD